MSNNKNIIFSSNTSWYLYNFRRSSIKMVIDMGFDVHCVAGEDKFSDKLKMMGATFYPLKIHKSSTNPFQDLRLIFNLYKIYTKIMPLLAFQFTIKNNIYGSIVSRILGIKCVNNISGLGTGIISNNYTSLFIRILYKLTKNFPHLTHFQNSDDLDYMKSHKMVNSKSLIIPGSGIDLNHFHPKFRISKKDNLFRFIFIGRLLKDKGLRELIAAMDEIVKQAPYTILKIIGINDADSQSGISIETLDSWKKKSYIHFSEETNNVRQYLSYADCLVLPSYREGLSRSILEAMSMGLPVVTTNVPGCRQLVVDRFNGFLCESKSISSLIEAMNEVMSLSFSQRQSFGKKGRTIVEQKFDIKIVEKSLRDCIIAVQNHDKI